MPKKLKLLIVANKAQWASWPEKIEALQKWFAWKVNLVVDLEHTSYNTIPFTEYPSPNGTNRWLGVDPVWYDDNVSIDALGYDIVLFVVPVRQWAERNRARGWRHDHTLGPIELQIAADEHEHLYERGAVDLGLTFHQYARHEIMHALFMMTGQEDRTHYWWDQGKLENALNEIVFPKPNVAEEITRIQKLLETLTALLARKRKQLEDMLKGPTVKDFALAIQEYEGYYAPGENPRFPNGTLAWRNKNPGNIRYAEQKRAIGKDKLNFAIFQTYEDGFATLVEMITRAVQGKSKVYAPTMTITEYFRKYAPSADHNNPDAYALFVMRKLGVGKEFRIKDLVIN